MSYKNMTKKELIEELKFKDREIIELEENGHDCEFEGCNECDECDDLRENLKESEDKVEELENENAELQDKIDKLEEITDELQDISNDLEDIQYRVDNLRQS